MKTSHILLRLFFLLLILAVLISDNQCLLIERPRVIVVAIEVYVLSESPYVIVLVERGRLGGVLVEFLVTQNHMCLVEKEVAVVLWRGQGHTSHICHLVVFILVHSIFSFRLGVIYD